MGDAMFSPSLPAAVTGSAADSPPAQTMHRHRLHAESYTPPANDSGAADGKRSAADSPTANDSGADDGERAEAAAAGARPPSPFTPVVNPYKLEYGDLSPYTPSPAGWPSTPAAAAAPATPADQSVNAAGAMQSRRKTAMRLTQDLEIASLKGQVESLHALFRQHYGPTSEIDTTVESLYIERDELRGQLERTELELVGLQRAIAGLQAEYRNECAELRRQVADLSDGVDEAERRGREGRRELDKAVKANEGLKGYLKELPSAAEYDDIKRSLRAKEESYRRLELKCDDLCDKVSRQGSENADLKEKAQTLQCQNGDLRAQLSVSLSAVAAHETRRAAARETAADKDSVEEVLARRDELADENERLRKYIKITRKRHDAEVAQKQAELAEECRSSAALTSRLSEATEDLRHTTDLYRLSQKDLAAVRAKAHTWMNRAQVLEKEANALKNRDDLISESDALGGVLSRELKTCLSELSALSAVTKQLVDGADPNAVNVSALLAVGGGAEVNAGGKGGAGVFVSSSSSSAAAAAAASSRSDPEKRLTALQKQLADVRAVKKDMQDMRIKVSDKLAENLAENMTSCITQ